MGFSDKRVYRGKGNVSVTDREEKIGLNVYRKAVMPPYPLARA